MKRQTKPKGQKAEAGNKKSSRDITERKQEKEHLSSSEAEFLSLFGNVPVGIAITDLQGNLLAFNDAALEMSGYTRTDIEQISDIATLYYDPKQSKEAPVLFEKQGFLKGYEMQFKHKDGTPFYVLLSLTHTIFNGTPAIQAIFEDVTERKQAENELRESEEKFSAAFHASPNLLSITRVDGTILDVNVGYSQMLGYSREKLNR